MLRGELLSYTPGLTHGVSQRELLAPEWVVESSSDELGSRVNVRLGGGGGQPLGGLHGGGAQAAGGGHGEAGGDGEAGDGRHDLLELLVEVATLAQSGPEA